MSVLLKRMLRIRPEEVTFARRNFHANQDSVRARLEHVGETFLAGYHAALAESAVERLAARLDKVEQDFRGFAYEGASMALDILDQLTPWKGNRLDVFRKGPGLPHIYMVHVGAGWSLARLRFNVEHRLAQLDPLLRWLALDGFGFHEGYFHWSRYARTQQPPGKLRGYGLRAFDQGLGRSLWFVAGADIEIIAAKLSSFPAIRLGDLWSGIGLACAYAGGADAPAIERIRIAAQEYYPCVAQGAVFAAKARERAGNPAGHTELACRILCGISAVEAARISDRTLPEEPDGYEPAYEVWRSRIRTLFRPNLNGQEVAQIESRWNKPAKGAARCIPSAIA